MSAPRTTTETTPPPNEEISIFSFSKNYVSTLKHLAIVTAVYLWAYLNLSIVWIYAVVIVSTLASPISNRKKRSKWRIARRMALGWEKDIILKLNHVPSWVTFPDVERAEWLNQIIKYLWPQVNEYMAEWIQTSIAPFLPSFLEFHKIRIGQVPLRIDGVKVFPVSDTTRKTIVMDLDVIYAGDCYITCRSYGIEGGISNFHMHGHIRVILHSLTPQIPLVGGIKAYFINEPDIDFSFNNATQVLAMAKDTIKGIIVNSINAMMVFPNTYDYTLIEGVREDNRSGATCYTQGVLRVKVVEGKNLISKDLNGKSDPYAILSLGDSEYKTKIIEKNLNPVWNEWFEFEVQVQTKLLVQLKDHDDVTKDEKLGSVEIDINNLQKNDTNDNWYTLKNGNQGQIHLQLTWMSLSTNFEDFHDTKKESQSLSSTLSNALLFVHIDSADNLNSSEKKLPDSYVVLSIAGKLNQTRNIKDSSDPIWNESFTFLLSNPDSNALKLEVRDKRTKEVIGELQEPLKNFTNYRNMEMKSKSFLLQKSPNSNAAITCSIKLFILKSGSKEEKKVLENELDNNTDVTDNVIEKVPEYLKMETPTEKNDIPNGPCIQLTLRYKPQTATLVVIVHQIMHISASDLYIKMYLQPGKKKQKTSIKKQITYPCIFDEDFEYQIPVEDLLTSHIEVMVLTEKKTFNRSNLIGQTIISISDHEGFIQTITKWFDLS